MTDESRLHTPSLPGTIALALVLQLAVVGWPSHVHIANQRALSEIDQLVAPTAIHEVLPSSVAITRETARHRRHLSALYPEPVSEHLIEFPRLLVECTLLQLLALPLWCLLIAYRTRPVEGLLARYLRALCAALVASAGVSFVLALISVHQLATSWTGTAIAGLRLWVAVFAVASSYLASLAALPPATERGGWRWTMRAAVALWALWSFHLGLQSVDSTAGTYVPGGLDALLLGPTLIELCCGLGGAGAWIFLFLGAGAWLRRQPANCQFEVAISSDSIRSDVA